MTLSGIIAIAITAYLIVVISGVAMWMKGNSDKNVLLTVIGSFLALNFLGVAASIMQIYSWDKTWRKDVLLYKIQKKENIKKEDSIKKTIQIYKNEFEELLSVKDDLTQEEFKLAEQKIINSIAERIN